VSTGTLVRLPNGKAHRLDYDDVHRLRAHFPTRELFESVSRTGYRLVAVTWPPPPARKRTQSRRRLRRTKA
jgi:hypothetical protein